MLSELKRLISMTTRGMLITLIIPRDRTRTHAIVVLRWTKGDFVKLGRSNDFEWQKQSKYPHAEVWQALLCSESCALCNSGPFPTRLLMQSMHVRRDFSSKQINKQTDPYFEVGSVAMRTWYESLHVLCRDSADNENLPSLTDAVENVSLQTMLNFHLYTSTCAHTTLIVTALYKERCSQSVHSRLYRVLTLNVHVGSSSEGPRSVTTSRSNKAHDIPRDNGMKTNSQALLRRCDVDGDAF